MTNFINYINTPATQTAGRIVILLALALILGSSFLAIISELVYRNNAKTSYPVRCHNITRSTWVWVIFCAIVGATIVILPRAAIINQSMSLTSTVISTGIAILLFLLYHFTTKIIKIKALHVFLALLAATTAKIAAVYWYLPASVRTGFDGWTLPLPADKLLSAWLQSGEMANFVHFILNAVAISALFFMLANAKEKEKKRRQPREYYFKASSFAGKWLLAVVTLQVLPLGWIFYNFSNRPANPLFTPPLLYWFSGMVGLAVLGWLLLLKINKDGLVNRRATFIIGLFFIASLCLLHFGPLNAAINNQPTTKTPAAAAATVKPAAHKLQTPQSADSKPEVKPETRR